MATKKRRKKNPAEGKIIFVLLPHTVQYEVDWNRGTEDEPNIQQFSKKLPAGMLAAQTGHVVSLMRTDPAILRAYGRAPITTLTFSVRNSKELKKVEGELSSWVRTWYFKDTNTGFYGIPDEIPTAVCTEPIEREYVEAAIGHLELYREIHQ